MANKPYKITEIQKIYGDLDQIIPKLVNTGGQQYAAFQLNVSNATISRWLKDNNYVAKKTYIKQEEQS